MILSSLLGLNFTWNSNFKCDVSCKLLLQLLIFLRSRERLFVNCSSLGETVQGYWKKYLANSLTTILIIKIRTIIRISNLKIPNRRILQSHYHSFFLNRFTIDLHSLSCYLICWERHQASFSMKIYLSLTYAETRKVIFCMY